MLDSCTFFSVPIRGMTMPVCETNPMVNLLTRIPQSKVSKEHFGQDWTSHELCNLLQVACFVCLFLFWLSSLPPCVAVMKHNTVKHRTCVRVVFIKVSEHFHLSLKIFSDQLLLLKKWYKMTWISLFLRHFLAMSILNQFSDVRKELWSYVMDGAFWVQFVQVFLHFGKLRSFSSCPIMFDNCLPW